MAKKKPPSQSSNTVSPGVTLNQIIPGSMNRITDKREISIINSIDNEDPMSRAYAFVDSKTQNPGRLSNKKTWWGIVIRNDTDPAGGPIKSTIPQTSADPLYKNKPEDRGAVRVWIPELHTHLMDPTSLVTWENGPAGEARHSESHKALLAIAELYPKVYGPAVYLREMGDKILGKWVEVSFGSGDNFENGSLLIPSAATPLQSQSVPEGLPSNVSPKKRAAQSPTTTPNWDNIPVVKTPPGKNPEAHPPKKDDDSILPAQPEEFTKLEINGERHVITPADCEWFARVIFGETFGKANRLDAQYMFWALVNRMGWGKRYWQMSIKDYFSTFSQPISPHWSRSGKHCRPGGYWSLRDPCNPARLRRRDVARTLPLERFPSRIIDLVNEFMEGKIPNPDPKIIDWFAGSMWKDKPYVEPGTPAKKVIKFVEGNAFIGYYTKSGTSLKTRKVKLIPGKTRLNVKSTQTGSVPMV